MHDTDRTQQFMEAGPSTEYGPYEAFPQEAPVYEGVPQYEAPLYEGPQYEMPQYEGPQYEAPVYEGPQYEAPLYEAPQFEGYPQQEAFPQYEAYPQQEAFPQYETALNMEAPLVNPMTGEVLGDMEIALAAELLGVSNEDELNQFFGKFVRGIGRTFKKFGRSGFGRTVFGALKNVARVALPAVGKFIAPALGSVVGSVIPGAGTVLGGLAGQALGGLATKAVGGALGLELAGLSTEDRQLEVARRIIRTGIESARQMDSIPEGEVMMEEELWNIVKSVGGRLLGGLASSVLSGGGAAGAQATGGGSGGLRIRSPGGWQVDAGGQVGGQATTGATVGINAPPPPVPFQPSPPGQVLPYPYSTGRVGPVVGPSGGGGGGGGGWRRRLRAGRWIRSGRNLIALGAY